MRLSRRLLSALLSFLSLLGLSAAAGAEEPADGAKEPAIERPFLWVVEGDAKIYLFGTMHFPESLVGQLPDAVTEAVQSSDAAFGELSPTDVEGMGAKVMELNSKGGKKLSEVLPEATYARLKDFLASKHIPIALFESMRLWVVAASLVTLDYLPEMQSGPAMDLALGQAAKEAGRVSEGLESVEEQIGFFESFTEAEQVAFLVSALDAAEKAQKEGKRAADELIAVYQSGDEAKLAKIFEEQMPKDEAGAKIRKVLVDDRNVTMVDRILERAKARPGKTLFVYVGAAHMIGENGIVALLAKKGLKPKRVEAVAATTEVK